MAGITITLRVSEARRFAELSLTTLASADIPDNYLIGSCRRIISACDATQTPEIVADLFDALAIFNTISTQGRETTSPSLRKTELQSIARAAMRDLDLRRESDASVHLSCGNILADCALAQSEVVTTNLDDLIDAALMLYSGPLPTSLSTFYGKQNSQP